MKTHVTVIPSDGIISVDGEVLFLDGITSETFHALQWHDGAGHVEPGVIVGGKLLVGQSVAGRVATQPMPVTDVPVFTGTTGSNIMKTMLPYLRAAQNGD